MDWYGRYGGMLIAALLGIACGYFISGVVSYILPASGVTVAVRGYSPNRTHSSGVNLGDTILDANVLNLDTGIAKHAVGGVKIASDIEGYKLIGFVSGDNPMVLFKKPGKPVVIVTRKHPLLGVWELCSLSNAEVKLKNRRTGEERKFVFPITPVVSTPTRPLSVDNVERVTVKRSEIRKNLGNINSLFRQINIVPFFERGKAVGYMIKYMSRGCILRRIGLRTNDVIVSVNGDPTTDPKRIMEIYTHIMNMTSVSLNILRNGHRKTIFVRIE